ncbi:hypothetical protein ABH920_009907 [Catenulispora sp. EB89]|uniref:DUF4253 domain-containing protein n=1 Tax=Catenulispora sp. EB89 TaxID=3156257 RepID=UPI003517B594
MDLMGTAVVKGTLADGTEVRAVTVEAGTALEAWRVLRGAHATTGLWPFLVDPDEPTVLDKLPLLSERRERHRGAAEIFASGDVPTFGDEPHTDQVSSAAHTTTVGLVPAEYGGIEVPGLLDWDGALGTSGVEHTAVLADWRRRFGAELLTLTRDRIELHVPRPPTEPEQVAAVAREQIGYCAGLEFPGTGTLWGFQWE